MLYKIIEWQIRSCSEPVFWNYFRRCMYPCSDKERTSCMTYRNGEGQTEKKHEKKIYFIAKFRWTLEFYRKETIIFRSRCLQIPYCFSYGFWKETPKHLQDKFKNNFWKDIRLTLKKFELCKKISGKRCPWFRIWNDSFFSIKAFSWEKYYEV